MNQKTVRRLVWLAVLSYLAPPVTAANECGVTTAVVEGVCATAGVVSGLVGGVLCGVTFGIGCVVAVVGSIAASTCTGATGNVNCGNPGTSADPMIEFMKDIQGALADAAMRSDLGFYESTYNNAINTIRMSLDRYDRDIIEKSSKPGNKGYIVASYLVNDWMEDILADGSYNVRGALDMIEDMIEGRSSITRTPSVYELAKKHNFCGKKLYKFITNLVTGGSTLVFVAQELKGYGVHDYDKQQLEDRLGLNADMFFQHCQWCEYKGKYLPGYAYSSGQNKYSTLLKAQQQCLVINTDCAGVTYEPNGRKYTLRKGSVLTPGKDSISWKRCSGSCKNWTSFNCNSGSGCSFGCTGGTCWKQCRRCATTGDWCWLARKCSRDFDCKYNDRCKGFCQTHKIEN